MNDRMDNFDQLFREKVENKQFKYRSVFWLQFAQKAGFAVSIYVKIALCTLVGAAAIAGLGFATYKFVNTDITVIEPTETPTAISTPEVNNTPDLPVAIVDTLAAVETDTEINQEEVVEVPAEQPTEKVTEPIPTPTPEPVIEKRDTVHAKPVVRRPRYTIKPVEINPDTITSND